jgi:molybdenum cofactor cytidylyltransferase
MKLLMTQALRVDSWPCMAFIGAGGKTTALFQLARQIQSPVIVTATSHLGSWQFRLADRHLMTDTAAALEELEHGLEGIILITGEMDGDRSKPISDTLLHWLYQFCSYHSIPLLIEADGSRQKPLKAWSEHEPPIPSFVTQVVQVVGLSGLGKALTDGTVHRPEIFSKLSGSEVGAIVTAQALLQVLTHSQSGIKNIPKGARRVIILNQADTDELQSTANQMVQPLLSTFDSVIIASLREESIYAVHERVAGIILAAGASTRFGQTKQLLDWHGQPFVRAVAHTALAAGLSPVVIVTGANAEQVELALKGLDVMVVHNADWKSGQGSSIRTGILSLADPHPHNPVQVSDIGAAIFLLADQPQITTSILRALVEKHAEGLYAIVAPLVLGQRANPVLFDRLTFGDLTSIEGDMGGRAVFHQHRVEYLPWHDERLLLDVDTPEMYQRLIADETS